MVVPQAAEEEAQKAAEAAEKAAQKEAAQKAMEVAAAAARARVAAPEHAGDGAQQPRQNRRRIGELPPLQLALAEDLRRVWKNRAYDGYPFEVSRSSEDAYQAVWDRIVSAVGRTEGDGHAGLREFFYGATKFAWKRHGTKYDQRGYQLVLHAKDLGGAGLAVFKVGMSAMRLMHHVWDGESVADPEPKPGGDQLSFAGWRWWWGEFTLREFDEASIAVVMDNCWEPPDHHPIHSIDVNGCPLYDRGVAAVAHRLPASVTSLDLGNTGCSDAGASAIAEKLGQSLVKLNCCGNPAIGPRLRWLQDLPLSLEVLNLSKNVSIGEAGWEDLAGCRLLTSGESRLRKLDLSDSNLGCAGVEALAPHLPSVMEHGREGTWAERRRRVDQDGTSGHMSLHVNVSRCGIGDMGARALVAACAVSGRPQLILNVVVDGNLPSCRKIVDAAIQQVSISITVRSQDGTELFFKVKRASSLKMLMEVAAQRQGGCAAAMRFIFDGNRLVDTQTPDDVRDHSPAA